MEQAESMALTKDLIMSFMRMNRMMISNRAEQCRHVHGHAMPKDSETMLLIRLKDLEEGYPDGISVSELSALMHIKPPSVTSAITKLEHDGMVDRRMDAKDRRIVRIRLTKTGNESVEENKMKMFNRLVGVVEHLGPEKTRTLTALINETFDYFLSLKSQNNTPQ